jgi:predicted transcriptional regulator
MLVNVGLLEVRDGEDKTYVATAKGLSFIQDFTELQKHSEVVEEKKRILERSLSPTLKG